MESRRNTYIDVLRAAAILPVLLTHWTNSGLTNAGSSTVNYLAGHGANGVSLFFVISGFVITRAAMARERDIFGLSYRTFYPRRFARICPLLAVVCIVGIGFLELSNFPTPLYHFVIRNPVAVFDAAFWASICTFTFNIWKIINFPADGWGLHWDVMWSLAVEEQFYVAFPVLIFLSKNRKRLFFMLLSIIVLCAGYRLVNRWNYSAFNSIVCFELIAAGVWAAVYVPQIPQALRTPLALLGGLVLCAGFLTPHGTLPGIFIQEFIAIGSSTLLCCAASAPKNRSFLIVPIAFIGELSYGMYLLHPMALYIFGETIRALGHVAGYFSLVFITTAISALSYRYYEKPAERFVRGALALPAKQQALSRSR